MKKYKIYIDGSACWSEKDFTLDELSRTPGIRSESFISPSGSGDVITFGEACDAIRGLAGGARSRAAVKPRTDATLSALWAAQLRKAAAPAAAAAAPAAGVPKPAQALLYIRHKLNELADDQMRTNANVRLLCALILISGLVCLVAVITAQLALP